MYKFLPSCNQTWQWTNPHKKRFVAGKRSINGTFPIAMFLTFPPSLKTWNIPNPSQNSKKSMGDFPICGSVLKWVNIPSFNHTWFNHHVTFVNDSP